MRVNESALLHMGTNVKARTQARSNGSCHPGTFQIIVDVLQEVCRRWHRQIWFVVCRTDELTTAAQSNNLSPRWRAGGTQTVRQRILATRALQRHIVASAAHLK